MKIFYLMIPLATLYVVFLAYSEIDTIQQAQLSKTEIENSRFTTKAERLEKSNNRKYSKALPDYSHKNTKPVINADLHSYKQNAILKIQAKENTRQNKFLNESSSLLTSANGFSSSINFDESYKNQIPSDTHFELINPKFNYRIHKDIVIDMSSTSTNGKNIPGVKYTIENSRGNLFVESRTDHQGHLNQRLKIKNGEKLYIRFYSPGIIQDKILINKEGEEQ